MSAARCLRPAPTLGLVSSLVAASMAVASPAQAQDEDDERLERRRRQARLRDPQGSVLVGVTGGASFSSEFSYGTIGAHAGYAVLTGVVPGIRGNIFFGDLSGGELAATAWLTPPLAFPVVPFAVGELGWAWQSFSNQSFNGALLGVGGGLHFGEPTDRFNLRAGVIYRYYDIQGGTDYWSPLIIAMFRF